MSRPQLKYVAGGRLPILCQAIGRLQGLLGAPAKTTRRIPADIYLNNKVEGTCAACGQAK
jgi:hypothetical protein